MKKNIKNILFFLLQLLIGFLICIFFYTILFPFSLNEQKEILNAKGYSSKYKITVMFKFPLLLKEYPEIKSKETMINNLVNWGGFNTNNLKNLTRKKINLLYTLISNIEKNNIDKIEKKDIFYYINKEKIDILEKKRLYLLNKERNNKDNNINKINDALERIGTSKEDILSDIEVLGIDLLEKRRIYMLDYKKYEILKNCGYSKNDILEISLENGLLEKTFLICNNLLENEKADIFVKNVKEKYEEYKNKLKQKEENIENL